MTNHTDLLRRALKLLEDWHSIPGYSYPLDQIEDLRDDLRTAIETGGWLPISEAKQDGTEYLLGNYGIPGFYRGYWEKRPNFWGKTGWFPSDRQYDPASSPICAPDCFMPLPPPPNSPNRESE